MLVPDRLPAGYATLLAGHGSVGKSGIALYLAVCMAAGRPFFGLGVAQRQVLYLSCEDREAVLHWRLTRICRHLGVDLATLAGSLDILDLVGTDSMLWERDLRTARR
jgi:RecA-family ATPase